MDDDVNRSSKSTEGTTWETRKLLHWVNSLPPPACLLVETLADLRFGDVLLAIVHWLLQQQQHCLASDDQGDDDGADPASTGKSLWSESCDENDEQRLYGVADPVLERLRRVVGFVAREARSQDCDALFVVNEAHCAEHLRLGRIDTICAVLRVLKRVSDHVTAQNALVREQQSQRECRDPLRAALLRELEQRVDPLPAPPRPPPAPAQRPIHRDVRVRTTATLSRRDASNVVSSEGDHEIDWTHSPSVAVPLLHGHTSNGPQRAGRPRATSVGLTHRVVLHPKTHKSRHSDVASFQSRPIPMHRDSTGQLHVYSMVDPSSRARSAPPHTINGVDRRVCDTVHRVRTWLASLGVELSHDSSRPHDEPHGHRAAAASPRLLLQPTQLRLEDGVLLCRLAAAVVTTYGSASDQSSLQTCSATSVRLPLGVTLRPMNAAQQRKNVAIAASVLTKYCQSSSSASGAAESACAELVSLLSSRRRRRPGDHDLYDTSVWTTLDRIRVEIEATNNLRKSLHAAPLAPSEGNVAPVAPASTKAVAMTESTAIAKSDALRDASTLSPCAKRKPFVTPEQMDAVHRWLAARIGSSVLEVQRTVWRLWPVLVLTSASFVSVRAAKRSRTPPGPLQEQRALLVRSSTLGFSRETPDEQETHALVCGRRVFDHVLAVEPRAAPQRRIKRPKTLMDVRCVSLLNGVMVNH